MPELTTVVVFICGIGLVAVFAWNRHSFAKARVLGALGKLHATQIRLEVDWFDFDRDTMTYDVTYVTRDGRRHANRCKVAVHIASDQGVYWERSLEGAA